MENTPQWYDAHLREFQRTAHIKSREQYEELYSRSLEDPDGFWAEHARKELEWDEEWDFVLRWNQEEAKAEWFGGGKLNAPYNCLDRHLARLGNKVAFYWEGDDPAESRCVTYRELHDSVMRFAAVLKSRGVEKGHRVVIYLPMVPELPVAMLACARIGAIHCVVYAGFSGEAVAHRIQEIGATAVITADGARSRGRTEPLKPSLDEALETCPDVHTIIVIKRCGLDIRLGPPREVWWHDIMADPSISEEVPPESMSAEDPLFILFAGAGVGKPRPLVHTHGGYLLWAAMTTRLVFDLKEQDTFWFTGDLAWIRGHTWGVYGPLLNGVSSVLFEGVPDYPDYDRFWQIVEKYRVDKFCTEPTVIRTLARQGTKHVERHDISCLKLLGSSCEPLSPEVWRWYYDHVGRGRCPIMESWWQTESAGPLMTSLPGVAPIKPGSVSFPFFGVEPMILDLDTGEEARFPNQEGAFFIGRPWPGMARTIYGNQDAFREDYFAPHYGMFITGHGARRDEDGYYWITGRIDDVIKVAGHRIGAWEVESALAGHPDVGEVTVVGFPHSIKGEGIYAFITLVPGTAKSDELREELIRFLKLKIGAPAVPDVIQWADALPKTRGGKILRRLLQKIAAGKVDDLGDTSTVANPEVIERLIRDRMGIRS